MTDSLSLSLSLSLYVQGQCQSLEDELLREKDEDNKLRKQLLLLQEKVDLLEKERQNKEGNDMTAVILMRTELEVSIPYFYVLICML